MTILFTPTGFPVSSSFSISTLYAATSSAIRTPFTASIAEYVINFYGPTGSAGTIVSASL